MQSWIQKAAYWDALMKKNRINFITNYTVSLSYAYIADRMRRAH